MLHRDRRHRRRRQGDAGRAGRRDRGCAGPPRRLVQLPALRRQPVQPRGRRLPERRVRRRSTRCIPSSRRCSTRATASTRARSSSRALAESDLVVCDRYVASNAAHQGAKLSGDARAPAPRLARRGRVRRVRAAAAGSRRPARRAGRRLRASSSGARRHAATRRSRPTSTKPTQTHSSATREVYLELAQQEAGTSSRRRPTTGRRATSTTIAGEVWRAVRAAARDDASPRVAEQSDASGSCRPR